MRRFLALLVFVYGLGIAATAGFIALHDDPDPVRNADAIVVLSGPGGGAPELSGETLAQTERGIALFHAGAAPILVMSGGSSSQSDEPVAHRMTALAENHGVPRGSVAVEPSSKSTLQNARFTRALPALPRDASIILVTHRYHLPRAWASFRWAGFDGIALVAADEGAVGLSAGLLMEGVKWPLNVLRAAGASLAALAGVPAADIDPFLQ